MIDPFVTQNIISITGFAAIACLLILRLILSDRTIPLVQYVFLGLAFFGSGLLFEINQVHEFIDARLPYQNIPIMLTWLFFGLTLYVLALVSYSIGDVSFSYATNILAGAYCIFLIEFSFGYLIHTASMPRHVFPRNVLDAVYFCSLYIYALIVLTLVLLVVYRLFQSHDEIVAQIRTGLFLVIVLSGVLFFLIRLSMLAFYPETLFLYSLSNGVQIAIVFFVGVLFLSKKRFSRLVTPVIVLTKVHRLYRLERLLSIIRQYQSPIVDVEYGGLLERYQHADFFLYRAVIEILDAKRMLVSDDNDDQLGRLMDSLNRVDDSQPYNGLVSAYAGVSYES